MLAAAATGVFGTLPGWLTFVGIVTLAWYLRGSSGGQALEILREQRDVLAGRVKELEASNAELIKRVSELEGKKDISLAIGPALSPIVAALHAHEDAAAVRTNATLNVLHMIAGRLGPEKEET